MKYSSGNHRRGTGRTKQRESKKAWLARRLKEEVHLSYVLTTPDSELSASEREEKRIKADWKVWTEAELREFIGL